MSININPGASAYFDTHAIVPSSSSTFFLVDKAIKIPNQAPHGFNLLVTPKGEIKTYGFPTQERILSADIQTELFTKAGAKVKNSEPLDGNMVVGDQLLTIGYEVKTMEGKGHSDQIIKITSLSRRFNEVEVVNGEKTYVTRVVSTTDQKVISKIIHTIILPWTRQTHLLHLFPIEVGQQLFPKN